MAGAPMKNVWSAADEIAISPEMIESGFRVLSQSGLADDYLEADRLMVADIFRAMVRAAPQSFLDALKQPSPIHCTRVPENRTCS